MDFRILGPIEALDDGHPVALGGSKQRALLALLLLHVNEPLSTARLIDELWGEHPPAAATKAVQVHVARLRKALAPGADGVVTTRERGYELTLAADRLDACRFDRLVSEGRAALAAGAPDAAASAFEAALSLFRGDPLADLTHEPFARPHIERLNDQRLAALEHLIEAKLALGRADEAVERLEPLIAEHPYRERFRAQLMLALYRCDRQADALQAYRDGRAKLSEDLGIEPGERLRELERAILAQDPGLTSPTSALAGQAPASESQPLVWPLPQALRISTATPFVGRERELQHLHRLWATVGERPRVVVFVAGEAGIGKTRLTAEFTRMVQDARGLVFYGRCDERLPVPYQAFADALRPAVEALGVEGLRARLGDLAPELSRLFPDLQALGKPARADPHTERLALFEAVLGLAEAMTLERRGLLVLDDLHWAPQPTLMLLRHLLLAPGRLDALLLLAYRDTGLDAGHPLVQFIADLPRDARPERIALGGLDEDGVAALLDAAPSLARRPAGLASRLHGETSGNPFFVQELLAHLIESGAVDDPRRSELDAPDQLRDLIAQRVAGLSKPAREILSVAAVAGPTFSVSVIEHAVGEEPDLLDAFDEATEAGLLAELGHGDYAFAHELVRHVIYQGLSSARRARLHRRVGEALEAIVDVGTHLEALSYHFAEAAVDGQAAKAADYALAAGRAVSRRLGPEEAAAYYRRGLRALDLAKRPDEKRRRELQSALDRTVYQPLPDLGELPLWLWRRLPRLGKAAVVLALVILVGLVLVFAPRIERDKREAAGVEAQRRAQARAEYIARATAEQRPRFSRGAPARTDRAARRRLVRAAASSVEADARSRVAKRRLKGPILRVECEPYLAPGTLAGGQDARDRIGRYDCLAVNADVPAAAGNPAATLGHKYRVRVDFQSGRYAFCLVVSAQGRARGAEPFVPLPSACGSS